MPKSVMDHIAISLRPDTALDILLGRVGVYLMVDPDDGMLGYKGRALIHTAGYPDDDPTCLQNLILAGVPTIEDWAAFAIHGWVEITEVKRYDYVTFAIDHELHGSGTDLNRFKAEMQIMDGEVYGIVMRNPEILETPVFDVLRDEHEIVDGDIWSPASPIEMLSFKMALRERAVLPKTKPRPS